MIVGDHQEWAKYSNYDVSLRVPLLIHYPFTKRHNNKDRLTNYKRPIELLDLMPTLIDLAELPPVPTCSRFDSIQTCTEGKSLKHLFFKNSNYIKSNSVSDIETGINYRYAFSQYPRPAAYPEIDSDEPSYVDIKYMGYSVRSTRYRYTQWIGVRQDEKGKHHSSY